MRVLLVLPALVAVTWGCGAKTSLGWPEDGEEPVECASSMDCDDGLFCTGQERCEQGVCVSGDPLDCGPADLCAASVCDETVNRCVVVPLSVDRDGDGSTALPCGPDCNDLDPSVGAGLPEACNDIDDDCDGEVDEDLVRPCGDGREQVCVAGAWGECVECFDPAEPVLSGWQENAGAGPVCFGTTFRQNGDPGEYDWASIPQPDDPAWSDSATEDAGFSRTSALCDFECSCLDGGDFTYFQQFVEIDAGYRIDSLRLTVTSADDGARVSIFSPVVPGGLDVGTIMLGGGPQEIEVELAPHLSTGENRIVVTHVDDCCSESNLRGLRVEVAGHVEQPCGL